MTRKCVTLTVTFNNNNRSAVTVQGKGATPRVAAMRAMEAALCHPSVRGLRVRSLQAWGTIETSNAARQSQIAEAKGKA